MRFEINRAECPTAPADEISCLRCVERYLSEGQHSEKHCFVVHHEDGENEVTVRIRNYQSETENKKPRR